MLTIVLIIVIGIDIMLVVRQKFNSRDATSINNEEDNNSNKLIQYFCNNDEQSFGPRIILKSYYNFTWYNNDLYKAQTIYEFKFQNLEDYLNFSDDSVESANATIEEFEDALIKRVYHNFVIPNNEKNLDEYLTNLATYGYTCEIQNF